ncbi:helix-turn-helix domain-containing protein [Undibacterium danionis]|uniref:Helix-turn-helix domain-containing protein n=1 Tax=Undibacterium danionis TaxID=1812100 RepID=A0ABV6IDV6_9BURK
MNNGNEIFALRLKSLRQESGLSQKILGIKAGIDEFVSSTRINRYEQAVHTADYTIVQKIAEVLNAPTAYFYSDDDDVAQLLLQYHRSTAKKKKEILKIVFSA